MNRSSEQGSAIIWILVALATFAALNYAFNSSSRTSTSLLTDEQASTYADQIISLGNDVKSAVKRMQLRGVDVTELSFANTVYVDGAAVPLNAAGQNANCTTEKCEVFSVLGGQVTPVIIDVNASYLSDAPGGHAWFRQITIDGLKTTESEIVMTVLHVKPEICRQINNKLNVVTAGDLPDHDTFNADIVDGTIDTLANPIGDTEPAFSGKKAFCSSGNVDGNYHFQQVLVSN